MRPFRREAIDEDKNVSVRRSGDGARLESTPKPWSVPVFTPHAQYLALGGQGRQLDSRISLSIKADLQAYILQNLTESSILQQAQAKLALQAQGVSPEKAGWISMLASAAAGSMLMIKNGVKNTLGGSETKTISVDPTKAVKGSPEFDELNNPRPNAQYELSNGTSFSTNGSGFVDNITFQPVLVKVPRDSRQTAVGKEGLPTDVGGHIQACSLGGTCDRYNLQDSNFKNSPYKCFENELRVSLKGGKAIGPVSVQFQRSDAGSARPDSMVVIHN